MLTIAKEHIIDHINSNANIKLFGQEVNDKTFAISKSDMLIKGDDKDADNIKPDSSFSKDGHAGKTFRLHPFKSPIRERLEKRRGIH